MVLHHRWIDGLKAIFYQDRLISRYVKTPVPYKENGSLTLKIKDVPFLDGVVDVYQVEKAIIKNSIFLSLKNWQGFTLDDRIKLRIGIGLSAYRIFDEETLNPISNLINKWALKKAGLVKWEFNEVGSLSSCRIKNKGLELFWQTCIGKGA